MGKIWLYPLKFSPCSLPSNAEVQDFISWLRTVRIKRCQISLKFISMIIIHDSVCVGLVNSQAMGSSCLIFAQVVSYNGTQCTV